MTVTFWGEFAFAFAFSASSLLDIGLLLAHSCPQFWSVHMQDNHKQKSAWELLKEKTPSFWILKHVEMETTSGAFLWSTWSLRDENPEKIAVCFSSDTNFSSESAAWTILAARVSIMKASCEFLTGGSFTRATLTKKAKWSTTLAMPVATLCNKAFLFLSRHRCRTRWSHHQRCRLDSHEATTTMRKDFWDLHSQHVDSQFASAWLSWNRVPSQRMQVMVWRRGTSQS